MAHLRTVRKPSNDRSVAIPASLTAAATTLMHARGLIDEIAQQCQIRREGGYAGVDLVLALIAFFSSDTKGIRPFMENAQPHCAALAAIAGRRRLPSAASISRALGNADHALLRPFERWLLMKALPTRPLFDHPAVVHRDATGAAYHVLHFDPKVTALRHRALPEREELPDAVRRSTEIGRAGRAGRHRGEVVFSRSVLQHAGTGLWLDMRVEPGNGEERAQLASAADAVCELAAMIEHPLDRMLLCDDGQWGGIPSIMTCRERGVSFVTRCSRYHLLQERKILDVLSRGTWHFIPDSGSGPRRSAIEAGWVLLTPANDTRREDGSPYAPQRVRLIVTRYPVESSAKPKRGTTIDGFAYEMFITDLSTEGWPAEDVCATYFGRCGQECRFAQGDREFALDRIYSYAPAGQELASTVGAFVWNLQILMGFLADVPPVDVVPEQRLADAKVDDRPGPPAPEMPSEPEASALNTVSEEEAPHLATTVDDVQRRTFRAEARATMMKLLPRLFTGSHLETKGWKVDFSRGQLVCPRVSPSCSASSPTTSVEPVHKRLFARQQSPVGVPAARTRSRVGSAPPPPRTTDRRSFCRPASVVSQRVV